MAVSSLHRPHTTPVHVLSIPHLGLPKRFWAKTLDVLNPLTRFSFVL